MAHKLEEQGFTLLEVMLGIAIFSLGLVAFFTIHGTSVRGTGTANRITEGVNYGEDRIEQMLNTAFDDASLTDSNGNAQGGLDDTDTGTNADDTKEIDDGKFTIFRNIAQGWPQANVNTIRIIIRNNVLNQDISITNVKTKMSDGV